MSEADIPVRRILPQAKPRNPKLADILRGDHAEIHVI
jgi:hypothetical protein